MVCNCDRLPKYVLLFTENFINLVSERIFDERTLIYLIRYFLQKSLRLKEIKVNLSLRHSINYDILNLITNFVRRIFPGTRKYVFKVVLNETISKIWWGELPNLNAFPFLNGYKSLTVRNICYQGTVEFFFNCCILIVFCIDNEASDIPAW